MTLLLYPLGVACVLIAAGLVFVRRRFGFFLVLGGLAWLWLWSTPIFSDLIRLSLERGYADVEVESLPVVPVTVVLGGAFDTGKGQFSYPNMNHATDRYWHAARLYDAGRTGTVILTGGRNRRYPEAMSEAESGALLLGDLGVRPADMRLENHAGSTRENAVLVGEILNDMGTERFFLVTSALHMPRAEAAFRKIGLDPVPVATDFEVAKPLDFQPRRWLPSAKALMDSSRAYHEYVGYIVYRLRGWV